MNKVVDASDIFSPGAKLHDPNMQRTSSAAQHLEQHGTSRSISISHQGKCHVLLETVKVTEGQIEH